MSVTNARSAVMSPVLTGSGPDPFLTINPQIQALNAAQNAVWEAIKSNQPGRLISLMKQGVNPNFVLPDHTTPLQCAVANRNVEMVRMLIDNQASPDFSGGKGTALTDVLSQLKLQDGSQGNAPYYWDRIASNYTISSEPVVPDSRLAACLALLLGDSAWAHTPAGSFEILQTALQQKGPQASALLRAAANAQLPFNVMQSRNAADRLHILHFVNSVEAAQFMLENGASIPDAEKTGISLLTYTISENVRANQLAHFWLQSGANPNLGDAQGVPVLYRAVRVYDGALVQHLLARGADAAVTQTAQGQPMPTLADHALHLLNLMPVPRNHLAISNATIQYARTMAEIASRLIQAGSAFSPRIAGNPPLSLAVKSAHPALVKLLLSRGVDVNERNDQQQPALLHLLFVDYGREAALSGLRPRPPKLLPQQLEIAKLLIEAGADTNFITPSPDRAADGFPQSYHYGALADLLYSISPKAGERMLVPLMQSDWAGVNPQRVGQILDSCLHKPHVSESDIQSAMAQLIPYKFDFYNRENAAIYAGHLHSWTGTISFDNAQGRVMAEGWSPTAYLPLNIKTLITAMCRIQAERRDPQAQFGAPKAVVLEQLKTEIHHQLTTFYSSFHQDMMSMIANPKLLNTLVTLEGQAYSREIAALKPGQHFAIYFGTFGDSHARYADFRKEQDGTVTRSIYNLGNGLFVDPNSHRTPEGRFYPNRYVGIPAGHFQNFTPQAYQYFKDVLATSSGNRLLNPQLVDIINWINNHPDELGFFSLIKHANLSPPHPDPPSMLQEFQAQLLALARLYQGYDNIRGLNGVPAMKGDLGVPEKLQLTANCSVKNNNFAMKNRLENPKLFHYLKTHMQAEALRLSRISPSEVRRLETEKETVSFSTIGTMFLQFQQTPEAAAHNYLQFLSKRVPGAYLIKGSSADKIANLLVKIPRVQARHWLTEVPGNREILQILAEHYHSGALQKAISHIEKPGLMNFLSDKFK